jgi:hypothetical protein
VLEVNDFNESLALAGWLGPAGGARLSFPVSGIAALTAAGAVVALRPGYLP